MSQYVVSVKSSSLIIIDLICDLFDSYADLLMDWGTSMQTVPRRYFCYFKVTCVHGLQQYGHLINSCRLFFLFCSVL